MFGYIYVNENRKPKGISQMFATGNEIDDADLHTVSDSCVKEVHDGRWSSYHMLNVEGGRRVLMEKGKRNKEERSKIIYSIIRLQSGNHWRSQDKNGRINEL